jgi:hypothetical protein
MHREGGYAPRGGLCSKAARPAKLPAPQSCPPRKAARPASCSPLHAARTDGVTVAGPPIQMEVISILR